MAMRVASLASGSDGNCYYLECSAGAVLIDAGLSGAAAVEHMRLAGGDPARVKGIIVTHDHADHVAGAGVLHRRHGWKLWMTRVTRDAARCLGRAAVETVAPGSGLKAAGFSFEFLSTPHDGAEPVSVVAERGGRRCGVLTDLGHCFSGLAALLDSLDFAFLESNHDPGLLASNPRYPAHLKRRIAGPGGHIANAEAGELVAKLPGERLRRVVLSHLSAENNRPALAYESFAAAAAERIRAAGMRVGVARRGAPMLLCGMA